MNARDDHDDLREAPTLRSIPKVDPFVVPDGFFDRFPQQVQVRLAGERTAQRRWGAWLVPLWRPAGATAAVAFIAIALFLALQGPDPETSSTVAEVDIAASEIDLDAFDDQDLYALLDEGDEPFAQAGEGLSDEELADYLENEELPLDLLIEEL